MNLINSRDFNFEYYYNQIAIGSKPISIAIGNNNIQKSLTSIYKYLFFTLDFYLVQYHFYSYNKKYVFVYDNTTLTYSIIIHLTLVLVDDIGFLSYEKNGKFSSIQFYGWSSSHGFKLGNVLELLIEWKPCKSYFLRVQ